MNNIPSILHVNRCPLIKLRNPIHLGEPSGKRQQFASYNWCIGVRTLYLFAHPGACSLTSVCAYAGCPLRSVCAVAVDFMVCWLETAVLPAWD